MAAIAIEIIVSTKLTVASRKGAMQGTSQHVEIELRPASNRMITNVTVVKTGPTAPRCWGVESLAIGPRMRPIIINMSTSGMRVRPKILAKKVGEEYQDTDNYNAHRDFHGSSLLFVRNLASVAAKVVERRPPLQPDNSLLKRRERITL